MVFTEIQIDNFRNFKNLKINLTNKNIIFGLNDIGKSNFLCAIRFLLDRNFRRDGLIDTDFYNKDTTLDIAITIKVNIEDEDNEDNKKIYKMMGGAIDSQAKEVYIQLKAKYDNKNLRAEPNLFWGTIIEKLEEIPSKQSFFELDKYFNVIYIDSSIQLDNVFKHYTKELLKGENSLSEEEKNKLHKNINNLNNSINKLEVIKKLEEKIVKEYKNYRDENKFGIKINSELEINNIHNKLTPYILSENKGTFPTSGDGRKKILSYTLLTLESKEYEEQKINIFLIEELENHLHRSMQIALSYQIFTNKIFKHLFLTTHSSLIISHMDDVNLIKLYKKKIIEGKSCVYQVPIEYKNLKRKLNENLTEAIYADVVLLVEGASERILFSRILEEKFRYYENDGGYILQVDGISFKEYITILEKLGIKTIVKTDNDLKLNEDKKEINYLGMNRCFDIIKKTKLKNKGSIDIKEYKDNVEYKKDLQKKIYLKKHIKEFIKNDIFLSEIDLENDLYNIIPEAMDKLKRNNGSKKSAVDYLQTAKQINMIELCNLLDDEEINRIYENPLFECLKSMVKICSH